MSDIHGRRDRGGWGTDAASRQFAAQYAQVWQAIAKMQTESETSSREFEACSAAMALNAAMSLELTHVILQGFPPTKGQIGAFWHIVHLPWFIELVRIKMVEIRVS